MSEISTPTRKPGRGLRIALVASLTLNVLVIGVLAGGMMRVARFEPMMAAGQADIRALWHALPDTARDQLRTMARGQGFMDDPGARLSRDDRRARAQQMNASILAALRAEPFDSEGFARLLSGDRDEMAHRLDAAHAAFAAEVAGLSRAERQAMAERLDGDWRHRRRR